MAAEKVRISAITIGQSFPQSLFSISGQKLLNAGVPITERHLQAMRRCGELEAYLADGVESLVDGGVVERFDSAKLSVGQTARNSVLTSTGNILLEAGQEIEQHHIEAAAIVGKTFSAKSPAANQRKERILLSDALVADLDQELHKLELRVQPETQSDWIRPAEVSTWPAREGLIDFRSKCVETMRQLQARIEAGVVVPISKFDPILDDLMDKLSKHPNRFTQLALLCPRKEDYLPDHAFTVTVLAMACAVQLHWPRKHVRDLGLAGLLFDLGMLLVPERIRTGSSQLSDIDRSRVHRHPVFTLAMLEVVDTVPLLIRLAAIQHQERENGAGYPRGIRKDAICDYARVLAVADTYAATTEPRTYRHPKLPYIAMEETLRAATTMVLWKPAVRALIQAAGLFPVGSYIKLSDGANACVISCNPKEIGRPSIQPLDVDGRPKGGVLDLATIQPSELSVVRPIPGPTG